MLMQNRLFSLLAFLSFLLPIEALAEAVLLPTSQHQLFQTYGLFFEEQSMLVWRQGSRAWGAVGGTIALLELSDWKWQPQLVAHGTANASFRLNSTGDTLLTETIDARVGLGVDLRFDDSFRGSITWTHQSGHIADNVQDADLIGSNLGNEIIDFRLIRDIEKRWRVGVGIRPTVGSDPGMVAFGAEQFVEWFPYGESGPHSFSPYLSAGTEEWGRHAIRLTSHVQVGFSAGNHFSPNKTSSLRVVLGYFNGNDPRLKYYQFKDSRVNFFYGGLAFDI